MRRIRKKLTVTLLIAVCMTSLLTVNTALASLSIDITTGTIFTSNAALAVVVYDDSVTGAGSVTVHATSTSSPAGIDIVCSETAPGGIFVGILSIRPLATAAAGQLGVADGDIVTVSYRTVTDIAYVDDNNTPAAPDAGKLTVTMNTPGTPDTVSGSAGAVGPLKTVKVYSNDARTALIGSTTAAADGSFSAISIGDNLYGTVWVTATSVRGNEGSTTSKTNDITTPTVSTVTWSGSSPAMAGIAITVTLTGEAGGVATFDIGTVAVSQSMTESPAGTYSGSYIVQSGDDGNWTITGYLIDAHGNVESLAAISSWVIDTVAPSAPVAGNLVVTMNASGTADTVSGSAGAVEGLSTVNVYSDAACTVLVGSTSAAADGSFAMSIGDNLYAEVWVTVTDAAGNEGTATSALNDIVAPAAPIVGNLVVSMNTPGADDTISGNVGVVEASATVNVYSDAACTALLNSTTVAGDGSFPAMGIGDNLYDEVWVTATDAAGNEGNATSVLNDIVAPTITSITWNAADPAKADEAINITLTGETGYEAIFDIGDVAVGRSMNETAAGVYVGTYTVQHEDDGNWTITGYLTDDAGNTGAQNATSTWAIDTVEPAAPDEVGLIVSMNTPGVNDTIAGSAGAVEALSTVNIYGDGNCTMLLNSTTAASDGSFTALGIDDNLYDEVWVTATDAAGNEGNATSVLNDIVPPVISNINVPTKNLNNVTITWTTNEPAICWVEYGLTNAYGSTSNATSLGTSHNITLTGLRSDALYHFHVVAADEHNNTASSADNEFRTRSTGGSEDILNTPPVADAGSDKIAFVGKAVSFSGSGSRDADGSISRYLWSFGDGESDTGMVVRHVYSANGTYTVRLTVTDDVGATDSDSITVRVEELPVSTMNETVTYTNGTQTGVVIDEIATMGVLAKLNTTGDVNVAIVEYSINPYPNATKPSNIVPVYIDIFVDNHASIVWPMYVEIHYTDEQIAGFDESSLVMYYYADGAWHQCSVTGVDTENNIVWAYLTSVEAAGSPLTIGGATTEVQYRVNSLSVTPQQVDVGETLIVSVAMENIGDAEGDAVVVLYIDGVRKQSQTVTLAEGVTAKVIFSVTATAAGSHTVEVGDLIGSFTAVAPVTPAAFTFSDLTMTPTEAEPEDGVTISVTVTNTGEESGAYSAELMLDGAAVETKTGTLTGGAAATVTFTALSEAVGTHTVQVGDQTGSFTVAATQSPFSPWALIGVVGVVVALIVAYVMKRNPKA